MSEEVKSCLTVSTEASKKVEKCAKTEEVNYWIDMVKRGRLSLVQRVERIRKGGKVVVQMRDKCEKEDNCGSRFKCSGGELHTHWLLVCWRI